MDLELEGKTAMVTGGSRGIGKAIALELAREGVDVAICARNEAPLKATAEEISAETGRRVLPVVADTSNGDSIQRLERTVLDAFGHVDILVNNAARAGGGVSEELASVPLDVIRTDFETKVIGYLLCARSFVPSMKERGWGRVINIVGGAARNAGGITSGTRNIASLSLSKTLARQLAPFGITVNVIHPGGPRTDAFQAQLEADARSQGITVEEAERQAAKRNPMGRIVETRDVAHVVVFLASPKAVGVTGEVIATGSSPGVAIYP